MISKDTLYLVPLSKIVTFSIHEIGDKIVMPTSYHKLMEEGKIQIPTIDLVHSSSLSPSIVILSQKSSIFIVDDSNICGIIKDRI